MACHNLNAISVKNCILTGVVCLLATVSFFCSADATQYSAKVSKVASEAYSVSCDAILQQSIISLANYDDWIVEKSSGISAEWVNSSQAADRMHNLAVKFRNISSNSGSSQLVIKSASLSAHKFNTLNAISVTFKSGVRGRLRLILRDSVGRLFSSKVVLFTGYPDWVEVTSPYTADAIMFHGVHRVTQALMDQSLSPPVSIDHIQVVLREGATAGAIELSDLVVSGESVNAGRSVTAITEYAKWLRSNCNSGDGGKQVLDIVSPHLREPIIIGGGAPIAISIKQSATMAGATLDVFLNRFGAEPVLLRSERIDLSNPGAISRKFDLKFASPGLYAVAARVSDQGGRLIAQAGRIFPVWDPPGNNYQDTAPEFFGMMYLDRFPDTRGKDLDVMRRAGVKIVRFPFRWSEIQVDRSQFIWRTYDSIMSALDTKGFIAQPMVFYTPKWASREVWEPHLRRLAQSRPQWIVPRNLEDMASFMGIAAARYKKQSVVWEVWNEPTELQHWIGGTADDYVELLAAVDREVKRAAPDAKVISAGIGIAEAQDVKFAPMIASKLASVADGFSIHAYDGAAEASHNIELAKGFIAAKSRDKGVWLNETGYLVDPEDPVGELRRSAGLTKTAVMARFKGVENFTWFIYRNIASSTKSPTDNYALVDEDGSVRVPILAYANTVRWLAGVSPVRAVDLGKGVLGFEFEGTQNRVIVSWMDNEYVESVIKLPVIEGMKLLGIYDMFGGKVEISGGVIRQGHSPVFSIYERDLPNEDKEASADEGRK